jgi:hypothetical protein
MAPSIEDPDYRAKSLSYRVDKPGRRSERPSHKDDATHHGATTMTTRLNPITTPRHELRAEKARRNKEAALNAFIGKKAEIDEMLARLQALSDDHFNAHPDEVNWGHVGTLEHYASLLKRITDSAFGEGEHAD